MHACTNKLVLSRCKTLKSDQRSCLTIRLLIRLFAREILGACTDSFLAPSSYQLAVRLEQPFKGCNVAKRCPRRLKLSSIDGLSEVLNCSFKLFLPEGLLWLAMAHWFCTKPLLAIQETTRATCRAWLAATQMPDTSRQWHSLTHSPFKVKVSFMYTNLLMLLINCRWAIGSKHSN